MKRDVHRKVEGFVGIMGAAVITLFAGYGVHAQPPADVNPIAETYMPVVIDEPFETTMKEDVAAKPQIMDRQMTLLERRYDLRDRPSSVMMSGKRKPVQEGVRVKLPEGMTWKNLNGMTPAEIREKGLFPEGFLPLPLVVPGRWCCADVAQYSDSGR